MTRHAPQRLLGSVSRQHAADERVEVNDLAETRETSARYPHGRAWRASNRFLPACNGGWHGRGARRRRSRRSRAVGGEARSCGTAPAAPAACRWRASHRCSAGGACSCPPYIPRPAAPTLLARWQSQRPLNRGLRQEVTKRCGAASPAHGSISGERMHVLESGAVVAQGTVLRRAFFLGRDSLRVHAASIARIWPKQRARNAALIGRLALRPLDQSSS